MTRYFYIIRYHDGTEYLTLTIDVPAVDETSAFIAAAGKAFAMFCNTQYKLRTVTYHASSDSSPEPEPEPTEDNGVE